MRPWVAGLGGVRRFLIERGGSLGQRTVRSGLWVGLSNAVTGVSKLATSMVLARLLLPEHFGLMGIALFVFGAIDVLSQPGLSAAILHRKDRLAEAVDAAWGVLILRGLGLALLTVLLAPFAARFYAETMLEPVLQVVAFAFAVQGFSNSHLILLRRDMDFRRLALLEISVQLLNAVVVVGLAYALRSVWALVAGRLTLALLRLGLSYVVTEARPRFRLPGPLIRELVRYGKFVTGSTVVVFLTTSLDGALIGKTLGMAALGYYVLATSLALLPATYLTPIITQVLLPAFNTLQDDLPALRRVYLRVLRTVFAVTLPAAVGLAVLAPEVVATVYGERWLRMVSALEVLCLLGALRPLGSVTEPVFLALGRPHVPLWAYASRLLAMAALLLPLTRRYDLLGAALAVTIPVLLEQLVLFAFVRSHLGGSLGRATASLAPVLVASAAMGGLVHLVQPGLGLLPPALALASSVLLGLAAYLAAMVALDRGLVRDTANQLKGLLGR